MKKIEKLTPAQEIELKAYYEEMLKFGRIIEPIDHGKCEVILNKFYKRLGKPEPMVMYFSSPMMCILAYGVLKNLKNSQLRTQLGSQIYSQIYSQLRTQLGTQIYSQIYSQLGSQLDSQLRTQLGTQIYSQLDSQLRTQIYSQLGSQLDSQLSNYFAGQQWIGWKAYYKFALNIGVKCEASIVEHLDEWIEEGKSMHWWFPYDGIVLVSERPINLQVNTRGQLHSETRMAIEYSDGWGFHYLNGVKVTEELVMTPAESLSMDLFKKEENADVKAEFVRKYGVERMLDLGKKVDSYEACDQEEHAWWWKSQYELWDMASIFEGLDYQPFIKMLNQTTGIWHVEAVSPNCRNIGEALKERFGGRDLKIVGIA